MPPARNCAWSSLQSPPNPANKSPRQEPVASRKKQCPRHGGMTGAMWMNLAGGGKGSYSQRRLDKSVPADAREKRRDW
jgi:hypothetical protein